MNILKIGGTSLKEMERLKLDPSSLLVHGGGKEITLLCQKLGIASRFKQGIRITDLETLKSVQMVLGKINAELVFYLKKRGIKAIGLMGMIKAVQKDKALGFVGEVTEIDTALLDDLLRKGYLPVIPPLAYDDEGRAYNLNADLAAAHLAIALRAKNLTFITDVAGVFLDPKDPKTKLDSLALTQMHAISFEAGMIPKLEAATLALQHGVPHVSISQTQILLEPLENLCL